MNINKELLLSKYFDEALEATKEIIKIPSYRRDLTMNSPVHEDTKRAVDFAVNECKKLGLKTFIAKDYRYAYADWENGDKLFGIICHLDVVPPGNLEDWEFEPFEPVIKDEKLYGRGSFDDKGPSMMNIFAVKYLIDHGFKPDYTIRFIFGTSEETNWECMTEYVKNERICDLGYVPDAEFPVVYAEKWIVDAMSKGKFKSEFTLVGGEVFNAVLDTVKYSGPKMAEIEKYLNENKIKTKKSGDELIIRGKSAHGSLPQKGISAASWALAAIDAVGIKHPVAELFTKYIHNKHDMKEVFGNLEDETGKLTVCNGIINIQKDSYSFSYNFRVPCLSDPKKNIVEVLEKFLKQWDMSLEIHEIADRVYFDQKGPVVSNIMKVYQEVTGDLESKPIAIGGGTFAKSMPNMIAFGAEFNINESTMHADNEFVKIEDLKKMLEIYCKAITKLTKIS